MDVCPLVVRSLTPGRTGCDATWDGNFATWTMFAKPPAPFSDYDAPGFNFDGILVPRSMHPTVPLRKSPESALIANVMNSLLSR